MIISFDRARVKETFILRQSLISSPVCRGIPVNSARDRLKKRHKTYLAFAVRPDHGDDDTVLVAPLAPVRGQDFQLLPVLQEIRQELELLPIQRDDADLMLPNATSQQTLSHLVG